MTADDVTAIGGLGDGEATVQTQYEGLATIYDFVMRHVDYREWVGYISDLFDYFQARPRHIVDLACGTGNATVEFHRLGHRVSGVDISPMMIDVARRKMASRGLDVRFDTGDLRNLAGHGPFDGAVCLYDSFNYLLSLAEIDSALTAVADILEPESLFVFDICTENNSLRYFGDTHGTESGNGFSYKRHSYYDHTERLQMNSFDIQFDGGSGHCLETHTQRIYPFDALVARIEQSSFELLGAYDGFTFRAGSEDSDRIHCVLRSPALACPGEDT